RDAGLLPARSRARGRDLPGVRCSEARGAGHDGARAIPPRPGWTLRADDGPGSGYLIAARALRTALCGYGLAGNPGLRSTGPRVLALHDEDDIEPPGATACSPA